jgi:hypothetical protein
MAIAVLVIAAGASLLRGRRYIHDEDALTGPAGEAAEVTAETAIGASSELAMEVAAEIDAEAGDRTRSANGSSGPRPRDSSTDC